MAKLKKGWVIIAIIVVLVMLIASKYNLLVTSNENINGMWGQVQNNLQRRADLIPNLVETVKGYAAHEESVYKDIADARSKLLGAQGVNETAQANTELSGALGRLLAISENYPNLKADQSFRALQDELAGTENRISFARKDYNDAVQAYNTLTKRFPANIIAGAFNFAERQYFQADETAQQTPKVQF